MTQKVKWERVFGCVEDLDEKATLLSVRKAVAAREWTDLLGEIFDSLLWYLDTPSEFAHRQGVSKTIATRWHDQGYRTLRMMYQRGWIRPILKREVTTANETCIKVGQTMPKRGK